MNERDEELIHVLREEPSYITVVSLAEKLSCSTKTIYRLIKKLNEEAGAQLVETEKGKGVRLNYDAYMVSRFSNQAVSDKKPVYYNFSPVERRLHVIKELLFHAPLSLKETELFERYYLSPSAIYLDEDNISHTLEEYGLSLLKQHGRLSIKGSEHDIRKMLIKVLAKLNLLNFDDLNQLSVRFNKNDLRFVINELEFIEKEIDSIIPAPYNINLLTHMYILIYRTRKGDFDQLTDAAGQNLSANPYYAVACKVTEHIEGYLCKELPLSETANICNYLNCSRMEGDSETAIVWTNADEATRITDYMIQEFAAEMKVTISHDNIYVGLLSHVRPLLNRLRTGLTVKNPLLDDIVHEYHKVFAVTKRIVAKTAERFDLPDVDEDEAGFITLYFARYLEQNPVKIKTLIVCTTGLGTSELLRAKVSRFFPEIEVIGTASTKVLDEQYLAVHNIDLILTTVNLQQDLSVRVVLVNTLFIERDKEKVRQALTELAGNHDRRKI